MDIVEYGIMIKTWFVRIVTLPVTVWVKLCGSSLNFSFFSCEMGGWQ